MSVHSDIKAKWFQEHDAAEGHTIPDAASGLTEDVAPVQQSHYNATFKALGVTLALPLSVAGHSLDSAQTATYLIRKENTLSTCKSSAGLFDVEPNRATDKRDPV